MAIGVFRLDAKRSYEGMTLGRSDDEYSVLQFTGPAADRAELESDLLKLVARRGWRLAEGFVVKPRRLGRISVCAVLLNADGTARAIPSGDHWARHE